MNGQLGFTLIELMVATAVAAILAAVAYPGFQGPLHKARRADGLQALLQLQLHQERWRSDHARYGTLHEMRASMASPQGHYRLDVTHADAGGFIASATAVGAQAGDKACKVLLIEVEHGNSRLASGADEHTRNEAAANKRCWNL